MCSENKQPSFWIKGAFGQQPRALGGFVQEALQPGPSRLSFNQGWVQPHRGSCFSLNYPSGSPLSLSFISTTGFQPDKFEQNLIWSVLTLLPRCWQRSSISSALGQVVSKHSFDIIWPLLLCHSLILDLHGFKSRNTRLSGEDLRNNLTQSTHFTGE